MSYRRTSMPDTRTRSPWYTQEDEWPRYYVQKGPVYTRAMFLAEAAGAQRRMTPLQGLGALTVPWQCWDTEGFKPCHANCLEIAQKAVAISGTKGTVEEIAEACMTTKCIPECEKKLAAAAPPGGSSGDPVIFGVQLSPATLVAGAVVLGALGLFVMTRAK